MTLYRIAVTKLEHRCPNFPDGHAWSISRRVVEVVESGPCLAPIAGLPCARRVRHADRCANCLNIIEEVEQ